MSSVVSPELSEYLAFLHDVIAAYHERLSEATSPEVARQVMAGIADKEARYLGINRDANPQDFVSKFIERIGMRYRTFKVGDQDVNELECPYASIVHPRIRVSYPVCPVSILALGAARLANRNLLIASNHLTKTGAKYTIAPKGS